MSWVESVSSWKPDELVGLGSFVLAIVVAIGSTAGWIIDRVRKNSALADVTGRLEAILNNKLGVATQEIERFIQRCKDDIALIEKEISDLEYRLMRLLDRIQHLSERDGIPPVYLSTLEGDKHTIEVELSKLRAKLAEIDARKSLAEKTVSSLGEVKLSEASQQDEVEAILYEVQENTAEAEKFTALGRVEVNSHEHARILRLEREIDDNYYERSIGKDERSERSVERADRSTRRSATKTTKSGKKVMYRSM